jgi:hypothetical protein
MSTLNAVSRGAGPLTQRPGGSPESAPPPPAPGRHRNQRQAAATAPGPIEPVRRRSQDCQALQTRTAGHRCDGGRAVQPQRQRAGRPGLHDAQARRTGAALARQQRGSIIRHPGSVIPLVAGASPVPLAQNGGAAVIVAEGIESLSSVAAELPDLRDFAAVSVTNLREIAWPLSARGILLAIDGDAGKNRDVCTSMADAIRRLCGERRHVRLLHPPPGGDFNDAAQRLRRVVLDAA